jgi:UDP:flavonoid glycosyltransferase YjiC (YdhE family)
MMARVLMVWELGSGMGHMDRMLICARALRLRGHEVRMALKDLSRAHHRIAADGFMMMQSPVWLPQMANPPRLANFAAILASAGWLNSPGLAGLVTGWRSLFDLNQPDAIICDHAPTAILAARGRPTPVFAVGYSFEVPPVQKYFPAMNYWNAEEEAHCASYDARVLAPTNEALALLGDPPLQRLTALFDDVHQAIVSIPELAHYPQYPPGTKMFGPAFVDDIGQTPHWPPSATSGTPKVFAYVAPTYGGFDALIAAIKASGFCAIIHAKGLSPQAVERLNCPTVLFEANALRMAEVLREADIVISHASVGTVSAAALAGKIQLGLPQHMEQEMVGRRMVQSGIGLAVPVGTKGADFKQLLQRLHTEPHFAQAARELAHQSKGFSSHLTGERVADFVESVIGNVKHGQQMSQTRILDEASPDLESSLKP